jgi:pimeloyl-ACP methyl ester carboxylesterase
MCEISPPTAPIADGRTPDYVQAAAREARALARVATLWPLDLGEVLPEAARDGDDVVVLVHGALATAGAWRPLRERLSRAGVHSASFTYKPSAGVVAISDGIRRLLRRLPSRVRVCLVGHSLGGLAVRWFVQEAGSDSRVVQTVTVAAPFAGARGASLLPGQAGRDMSRGSPVLDRLSVSALRGAVPHLSILGSTDTAVSSCTTFPCGERLVIAGAGHNALLFHDDVADAIVARFRRDSADS